ncbi:MAG: hypothetical protein MUO76_11110 [Anaerolineaceae bacterium]|nr:hypothetical protein [Anaerolineaceae bacterium]
MGREKVRKLHRRQRRQHKLRLLKIRLAETTDLNMKKYLIGKINKISLHPVEE